MQQHLREAKINREKNAQISSHYQAPKSGGPVDMGDLAAKLQGVQDKEQSEAESKCSSSNFPVEKAAFPFLVVK